MVWLCWPCCDRPTTWAPPWSSTLTEPTSVWRWLECSTARVWGTATRRKDPSITLTCLPWLVGCPVTPSAVNTNCGVWCHLMAKTGVVDLCFFYHSWAIAAQTVELLSCLRKMCLQTKGSFLNMLYYVRTHIMYVYNLLLVYCYTEVYLPQMLYCPHLNTKQWHVSIVKWSKMIVWVWTRGNWVDLQYLSLATIKRFWNNPVS